MKKLFSLLLVTVIAFSMFAVTAFAAQPAFFSMTADTTELEIGDEVTLTIGNIQGFMSSFASYVKFDPEYFDLTSIKDANGVEFDAVDEWFLPAASFKINTVQGAFVAFSATKGEEGNTAAFLGSNNGNAFVAAASDCIATVKLKAKKNGSTNVEFYEGWDYVHPTQGSTKQDANTLVETVAITVKSAAPEVPDEPSVEAPSTVEKSKTWNVVIDGGYVTANDTLTATLYDTTNEADKQDVVLSIGEGVWGEAGWSFSLKANFNDENKMKDINLKVAKN